MRKGPAAKRKMSKIVVDGVLDSFDYKFPPPTQLRDSYSSILGFSADKP
jgi:hypothetical protein